MILKVFGALFRAVLVAFLVLLPAVVLPTVRVETAQVVMLFALFAGVLTLIEYSARYPGLIEFRFAPPYNRIRFVALALNVLMLALLLRGQSMPGSLTLFFEAVGALIGHTLDFPYSPVRLIVLMLPADASLGHMLAVRSAAGVSYAMSLAMIAGFGVMLWLGGWPTRDAAFNLWVNLPTFDPMAGEDVAARLQREARLNVLLGFLLPFLLPMVTKFTGLLFQPVTLTGAQTLIWVLTAWAFLPAMLLMRGLALARIASLIRNRQRRATDPTAPDWQAV